MSTTNTTSAIAITFKEGDTRHVSQAVFDAVVAARLIAAHISFPKYEMLTRLQVQQVAAGNIGHAQALHSVVRLAVKHPLRYGNAATDLLVYLDEQTQAVADKDDRVNLIRRLFGLPVFTKTAAERKAERVAATVATPPAPVVAPVVVTTPSRRKPVTTTPVAVPAPASDTPSNITVEEEVAMLRAEVAKRKAALVQAGLPLPEGVTPLVVTPKVNRRRKAAVVVAADQQGAEVAPVFASKSEEIAYLLRGVSAQVIAHRQ